MTSPSPGSFDPGHYAGSWALEPGGTSVEFRTKALWVLPAKGTFRAREGAGTVAPDGGITGTLIIDSASVDTRNTRRDAHLRAADFLGVETYPTITFEVTGGRPAGPGTVALDGTLTVRGKTRPLSVSATVGVAGDSVTLAAEADVDRSDWGLTSTSFGAGLTNTVVVRARFHKV